MPKPLDLVGFRSHRLLVLHLDSDPPKKDGARWWVCKCDCGKQKSYRGADIKDGKVKSCGCWNSEVASNRNRTHGLSHTNLFKRWQAMRGRCNNENDRRHHKLYMIRGIKVCEEWDNDFMPFYEWSMANGYDPKLSLDRIDNAGPYSPENCRWTTQKVQVHNRRSSAEVKRSVREWEAKNKKTLND